MPRNNGLLAILFTVLLVACGKTEVPEIAANSDSSKPTSFTFSVQVALSDAAKKQFETSGESVIVAAMYFGGGKTGVAESEFNDVGLIDLGRAEIELSGEGNAALDGHAVLRERLDLVEGDPQVNVNVYSGRHSSPDNLLNCGMFQDAIKVAVATTPIKIDCRLILEGEDEGPQK